MQIVQIARVHIYVRVKLDTLETEKLAVVRDKQRHQPAKRKQTKKQTNTLPKKYRTDLAFFVNFKMTGLLTVKENIFGRAC